MAKKKQRLFLIDGSALAYRSHFGFGSNATVGGQNDVSFHLDVVFREETLEIDGSPILEHGEVLA